MILSNDGLVAFHYRSYGTFFLQQNRLHNIHRGFTHYKYYRAVLKKCSKHSKIFGISLSKSLTFFFKIAQACSIGFKSGE